jgi:5-methylcytosine-specific restriction protein A
VAATQATDHVIPPKGDMVLFWDADNWQPACGWHHDVVKQRLELAYGRGDIDASALRLDSPQAVALSLELIEAGEGPR